MILYLVDDEKNIRESIKEYIPWGDFGVTQVITAKSGTEALEKMLLNPPDVLLSDIRMPKMNGIEFATKVKEAYPDCVILFLSGYADKDYLKSAITLEAFQYIEKPIDINSLQKILSDAVSKKKRITDSYEYLNHLEKSNYENRHIIRQNIINLLISSDPGEIAKQVNTTLGSYKGLLTHSYIIAYVRFNWSTDLSEGLLYDTKSKILSLTLADDWMSSTLAGFNTDNDLIILFDGRLAESQITLLLEKLTHQFDFSDSYSIGISRLKNKGHNFTTAYLEAKAASSLQFFYGVKQIIEYSISQNTDYELPQDMMEQFKEALGNPEISIAANVIDRIYDALLKNKPDILRVKSTYTTLFHLLDQEARKTNNPITDFVKNEQISKEIGRAYLLRDIHSLLTHTLRCYYDYKTEVGSSDNRIKDIVQYIKRNISDSQLSVNTLSGAFCLSQAYLCSYFKKETQYTINQYITNIRIEQAKYLLSYTNDKIYDIALKIGFCDTNYFSALFKKQVGITPLEYRKGN
jgi:two-component system response regulator YesN